MSEVNDPIGQAGLQLIRERDALQAELAALRAQVAEQQQWRERAEVVLGLLSRDLLVGSDDFAIVCLQCQEVTRGMGVPMNHAPDCPVVQARTLLGEGGQ